MNNTITNHTAKPIVRTLDNGLTVLMEPLPHLRSVSTGVWIKAGSSNETVAQSGISHFLEHLFFKGTTSRTARQIMLVIESKGGHLNAFTSRDYTCLYAKTLDEHCLSAIEVLGDIVVDSQFFDFDKERNVVLEEIASAEDVPEEFVHDALTRRVWPDDPLGAPIAGTCDSVSAMTVDHVRDYYHAWYNAENMVVSVAGRFDPDAVCAAIEQHFQKLKCSPIRNGAVTPAYGAGLEVLNRDIGQSHVCLGFPGPTVCDDRRYTFSMLSSVLGGGSTSRLFERIRENEGLAYSIYAYYSSYIRSGMLGVYAAVASENTEQTIRLTSEEITRLREEPIPDDEIQSNREQLKGSVLMALENTFNRMARMAKSMLFHGRIYTVDEVIASIDSVTGEQIQTAANEIFQQDSCALVVLGPENGTTVEHIQL